MSQVLAISQLGRSQLSSSSASTHHQPSSSIVPSDALSSCAFAQRQSDPPYNRTNKRKVTGEEDDGVPSGSIGTLLTASEGQPAAGPGGSSAGNEYLAFNLDQHDRAPMHRPRRPVQPAVRAQHTYKRTRWAQLEDVRSGTGAAEARVYRGVVRQPDEPDEEQRARSLASIGSPTATVRRQVKPDLTDPYAPAPQPFVPFNAQVPNVAPTTIVQQKRTTPVPLVENQKPIRPNPPSDVTCLTLEQQNHLANMLSTLIDTTQIARLTRRPRPNRNTQYHSTIPTLQPGQPFFQRVAHSVRLLLPSPSLLLCPLFPSLPMTELG